MVESEAFGGLKAGRFGQVMEGRVSVEQTGSPFISFIRLTLLYYFIALFFRYW